MTGRCVRYVDNASLTEPMMHTPKAPFATSERPSDRLGIELCSMVKALGKRFDAAILSICSLKLNTLK